MTAPLITIGITCYNAASTIDRAIDSALAQDWPNIEIIVVDDGSTDDSIARIERRRIEAYAKITLIKNPVNLGVAGASNRVIDSAHGTFVAFFDDDDESLPPRLRRQYETITAYERETGASLIACFISGERLYPNGHRVPLDVPGTKPVIPIGEIMADYLLFYRRQDGITYGGTPACAMMARTETFKACGLFDQHFRRNHDIEFCVNLALRGGHFIGCPDRLLIQHATQGSDKAADAEYAAWTLLIDKYRDYLTKKGVYDYAKRWIRLRHMHFSRDRMGTIMTLAGILLRYPVHGLGHFLQTGPKRIVHEFKMRRGA